MGKGVASHAAVKKPFVAACGSVTPDPRAVPQEISVQRLDFM